MGLASLLLSAWTVSAAPAQAAAPSQASPGTSQGARAALMVGPGYAGEVQVRDAGGGAVASVQLRPADQARLDLPPGRYELVQPDGQSKQLELAGERVAVQRGPEPPPPPRVWVSEEREAPAPAPPPKPRARELRVDPPGAAAASAVIPGLGQMLNGRGATGAGIFLGSVALGAASLLALRPPNDPTRLDIANETARLGGFALSTAALQMLWAGQAMHAYRDARGEGVTPRVDHRFQLDVSRFVTLAPGAAVGTVQYLRDWNLSFMGQPFERVLVGLSDVGLRGHGLRGGMTYQLGAKVAYRVYERRAVWMNLGLGVLGQLDTRPNPLFGVAGAGAQPRTQVTGNGSFYLQYDLRIFIVDRWSLNLMPRVLLPVGARRYQGGRAVASMAPTLEFGSGVGVLF